MEKTLINNREKVEEFKNNDVICIFTDDKILYKLTGENVWFLLDYNGNPINRITPDGINEFSNVDFYDMEGDTFAVEFG